MVIWIMILAIFVIFNTLTSAGLDERINELHKISREQQVRIQRLELKLEWLKERVFPNPYVSYNASKDANRLIVRPNRSANTST